jgi:nucleotide-binding universal stress UspA family protein
MSWFPKKKVVVPVDFSDESLTALGTALELVDNPANVLVVHVLQEPSNIEPGEVWGKIHQATRIGNAVQALREHLDKGQHYNVSTEVVIGNAGHEIAAIAEREIADLIVLTPHGRTGLKRMLIGSVTERVIRLAHCPVLVLRS